VIVALVLGLTFAHGDLTLKVGHYVELCDCRPLLTRIPGSDLQGRDLHLTPDAAEAWNELVVHAAKQGIFLQATYAHRDHDQQNATQAQAASLGCTARAKPS
jgi:hypothetical protein